MGSISGTAGNDVLTGTEEDDVIGGLGGDDTISALGGNDTVYAGTGNDTVHGGEGNDSVHGAEGNDTINGDGGDDYLSGGLGSDVVSGGAGNDTLVISNSMFAGSDIGSGDQFHGGEGTDRLLIVGDYANFDLTGITINSDIEAIENQNLRVLLTLSQFSQFSSIQGIFQLVGSGIFDLTGNRFISGSLYLDSGNDTVTLAGNSPIGSVHVDGGGGNDHLTGSDGNDGLIGGQGDDTLIGADGSDFLTGGEGADSLSGGWGEDTLYDGFGNDILDGGEGNDTFHADLVEGFSEGDQIIGGAGTDTLNLIASPYDTSWLGLAAFNITQVERIYAPQARIEMTVAQAGFNISSWPVSS